MSATTFKLNLKGSLAKPTPLIGPTLSSYGINIGMFCAQYNEKTKEFPGVEIPVIITMLSTNKFCLTLLSPSLSFLINIFTKDKMLTLLSIKKILSLKRKDLYPISRKDYLKLIQGTLNSMGIKIIL